MAGISSTTAAGAVPALPYPDVANYSVTKSLTQVITEFFNDKKKDLVKVIGYGAGWLSMGLPSAPPVFQTLSSAMGDTKNLLGATEIPKNALEARDSIVKFVTSPSVDNAQGVISKTTKLVDSACNGTEFAARFIPVAKETMTTVKTVNFSATLIGGINSIVEQGKKLHGMVEANIDKIAINVIGIARDTSYVALAILGLSSILFSVAVAPWVMLACLTSGLTFTIGGFFYERLRNVDGKGEDVEKVNQKLRMEAANLAATNNQLRAQLGA